MNPALDWLHADFNHTLVGACNEVYNLQKRHGDVARPLDMTISVADSAPRGDEAAWMVSPSQSVTSFVAHGVASQLPSAPQVDWAVNEGLPQCASGLADVELTTSYERDGTRPYAQTAHLHAV